VHSLVPDATNTQVRTQTVLKHSAGNSQLGEKQLFLQPESSKQNGNTGAYSQ
jgi:hypothetical protein